MTERCPPHHDDVTINSAKSVYVCVCRRCGRVKDIPIESGGKKWPGSNNRKAAK